MQLNMLPFVYLGVTFFFGTKALLLTGEYLILAYTNQTLKEKSVRNNNSFTIEVESIDLKKGFKNILNFYLNR